MKKILFILGFVSAGTHAMQHALIDLVAPLHQAVKTNDSTLLQKCLTEGVAIDSLSSGFTPLAHAIMQGNMPFIKLLKENKANLECAMRCFGSEKGDNEGASINAFTLALKNRHFEVFHYLLAYCKIMGIEARDLFKHLCISFNDLNEICGEAMRAGYPDIVQFLTPIIQQQAPRYTQKKKECAVM